MSERAPPRLRLVYSCEAFPLAGSTRAERRRVISWALHQLPPHNLDPEVVVLRRALFDLAMIDDEREARLPGTGTGD